MREMLSRWPSRHVLALVALVGMFGGATLIGLTAVVLSLLTHHERETQRTELEASLKQEMINRGMTAAEIDQVIRSTVNPWDTRRDEGFWRSQLVKDLKKQGMKADEIERIVKAAYPSAGSAAPTAPVLATTTATRPMPAIP
jgi:hypothetical protein